MPDGADRIITTILREEADRQGAAAVAPALDDLGHRAAARHRRARWGLAGVGAVVAAATVAAVVWATRPPDPGDDVTPATADDLVAATFDVPTFVWNPAQGGDSAEITGVLAFTDAGCPLLVDGDRVSALLLPNATGVRYTNGVRGVVDAQGRVYGTEGQPVKYGGGWAEPGTFAATWAQRCAATPTRDIAYVNDVAASGPLTALPAEPAEPLPTAPSSAEELGWFEVPTYPLDGTRPTRLDGSIYGVVRFTDEGCPYVQADGARTGLVFPNAQGFREPGTQDPRTVMGAFDDGTSGVMATEGEADGWGGGLTSDHGLWDAACGASPVEAVFVVVQTLEG